MPSASSEKQLKAKRYKNSTGGKGLAIFKGTVLVDVELDGKRRMDNVWHLKGLLRKCGVDT